MDYKMKRQGDFPQENVNFPTLNLVETKNTEKPFY